MTVFQNLNEMLALAIELVAKTSGAKRAFYKREVIRIRAELKRYGQS